MNSSQKVMSYAEALRDAQDYCLKKYPEVVVMGLGVPDPKGIFGTTLGLQEKYGDHRVFDIPLSENSITGVTIGCAISGMRPVLTHQRVDFALVSIEQIVNQAAKWHFMFGGKMRVPIVIRMVIGRGWGQGPQHSQSLQSWFGHIPGLKVIMPSTPYDAKGMLIQAIEDPDPVISLEHRWLFDIRDAIPEEPYNVQIDKARVIVSGGDITMVGVSYMVIECMRAAELLKSRGINAEVVDLRSIRPIDFETIIASVSKTRNLLIVDNANTVCGVSAEISAVVVEALFSELLTPPQRLGFPDHPVPTSPPLANAYYPQPWDIASACAKLLNRDETFEKEEVGSLDQPHANFKGPF